MAWIEAHQGLAQHPKTKRMARMLGISTAEAIGHLFLFWWWAMDYAEDGDLSRYDAFDIADAAQWTGDAGLFFDALMNCGPGGAFGFIEKRDDGVFVHDWDTYIGRLIDIREKNRQRKAKSRESKTDIQRQSHSVTGESQGCHADVTGESQGCHAGVTGESQRRHNQHNQHNQPNNTPPPPPDEGGSACGEAEAATQIAQSNPEAPATTDPGQSIPAEKPSDNDGGARPANPDGKEEPYPQEFETFYAAYPRRVQKRPAFKAWQTLLRQGVAMHGLMNAAAAYQSATALKGTPQDKIMHPATFLHEDRWRDWLPPDGASYLEAKGLAQSQKQNGGGAAKAGSPNPCARGAPMTYEEAVAKLRGSGSAVNMLTMDAEFIEAEEG